jgi:hypothetical protein
MIKVYYNCLIDSESHPQITSKKSAVLLAQTLTTNQITPAHWEADEDYKYLIFREAIEIDDVSDGELEDTINQLK